MEMRGRDDDERGERGPHHGDVDRSKGFEGCWQGVDISGAGFAGAVFVFFALVLFPAALGTDHWAESDEASVTMGLFQFCDANRCQQCEQALSVRKNGLLLPLLLRVIKAGDKGEKQRVPSKPLLFKLSRHRLAHHTAVICGGGTFCLLCFLLVVDVDNRFAPTGQNDLNLVTVTEACAAFLGIALCLSFIALVMIVFGLGRTGYDRAVWRAAVCIYAAGTGTTTTC